MGVDNDFWTKQVEGFCSVFGFKLDQREVHRYDHDTHNMVFSLKSGRSTVAYKDKSRTWRSGELPLAVECAVSSLRGRNAFEENMKQLMALASGKELIVRSSDKDRKTPYGFTKVRLIRHIKLPEFGSVEELKLKLAVSGEDEP